MLAQVVVYLEVSGATSEEIHLTPSNVALLGDGEPVLLKPLSDKLNSLELAGKQLRFIETEVPPGRYQWLQMDVSSVTGFAGRADIHPQPDSEGVRISLQMDLVAGESYLIRVRWHPHPVDPDADTYRPRFTVVASEVPPLGSLAWVSNEESGNLSVVDRFNQQVVDVIRVGSQPRGMAWSPLNRQLYVANAGSSSLMVIDGLSREVIRTIPMNYGDEPSRVALSPDETVIYVVNYGSNTLAAIDIRSLQEMSRQIVGTSPRSLTPDRTTGYIYVANELSDDIAVYDPVSRSVVSSISPGSSPRELFFNSRSKQLYLSQAVQRTLSIFDTQTGALAGTMNLCSPAVGFDFNPISGRLYVALERCEEIAVLKPDSELELASIRLPGQPGQIKLGPDYRQLLVALPQSNQLAIYSTNSRKLVGLVNVGEKPYMAIVPQ